MERIVALAATTDLGHTFYFMTWGRIQAPVDSFELEAVVLAAAPKFTPRGKVTEVRLCGTLQEATAAPWFYECFFEFCQTTVPDGPAYESWRAEIDQRMRDGHEIASLGFNA